MTRLATVFFALVVFALPTLAHAETLAQPSRTAETAEGADLETFARGVHAAAEAEGAEAPSRADIEAAFAEADANGDGMLDAREQSNSTAPTRCNNRGVCHMGRCFCVSGRLIEDGDASTTAHENPVFQAPSGPSNNVLND